MLNFLTKHYWWITIILIGMAAILDLKYDVVETIKTPNSIVNPNGVKEVYYTLTLKDSYQLVRALINILYSLGVSLIVLVAIDKRIDTEEGKKYQSDLKELDSKIHNNIFDGVLNKIVPEKLFDQVKKDIFNKEIVRKNAKWTYQISHNVHESFTLQQTIQYEIENLTEDKIEQNIPVNIHFSNSLVETKITHWQLKSSTGQVEREESINFDKLSVILEKRETKKVELNIKSEFKTKAVMDNHVTNFSIIGLEIQIQKPEDVKVEIIPSFSTKLIINTPNNQLITFDKIPCILLGQGVGFIIEKNNIAT